MRIDATINGRPITEIVDVEGHCIEVVQLL
jgi:hypothetical protein